MSGDRTQRKTREVFLIGAGFSKAADPEMPLMSELWEEAVEPELVGEHLPLQAFNENVELLLSYLSQRHPWQSEREALMNRAAFIGLQDAIARVFERREETLNLFQCRPRWLSSLITHWRHSSSTVVTLNYDTCVEEAALGVVGGVGQNISWHEVYGTPIPSVGQRIQYDPETGRDSFGFRLLKLHGSSHWRYSGELGDGQETIYRAAIAGIAREMKEAEFPATLGGGVGLVPFIVPMVADKSSFYQNPTLRTIWSQAAEALSGADRVYCMGYSLPQTDLAIRYLLAANQPQQRASFHVVSLVTEQGEAIGLAENYECALSGTRFRLSTEFVTHQETNPIARTVEAIQDECPACR